MHVNGKEQKLCECDDGEEVKYGSESTGERMDGKSALVSIRPTAAYVRQDGTDTLGRGGDTSMGECRHWKNFRAEKISAVRTFCILCNPGIYARLLSWYNTIQNHR